jgi:hypothetical protein
VLSAASDADSLGVDLSLAPRERALGVDRLSAPVVLDPPDANATGTQWLLEAGQWNLYGIKGVHGGAFAVEVDRGGCRGVFRAGRVSSPVGSESAMAVGVLAGAGGRFWAGATLRLEIAEIEGCVRTHLLTVSPCVVVRMAPGVSVISVVEGVRVTGEEFPGADASLSVVAGANRSLSAAASVTAARDGAFTIGVASRLRLGRGVALALGYSDDTGAFESSLVLRVRSLAVDAGATAHPVLGISKALFLSWGWGR